ncbi:ABC transporter ATP-binding protein [Streptomyces sp. AK02-01A]|uniref:ABC transporter ATP-binding protein n=1 Tax=Streptomyces sp. AK02-01A TaxID=3028648 RepID=UPI0029ABFF4B|nr:ABC transporter ATP-binding protein [Streptomyces sp. AK02-01A]MDX3853894.1 ABC transporter ATP-binding protein [Streptomyces sp. AK02-01A]
MKRNEPPGGRAAGDVLVVEGLVKTHRVDGAEVRAVRGVDLRVRAGEFVAVTGPSGAGKSTLLHLLGGLERPDRGRIWLDGRRVDTLSEARWATLRRRGVGIVFQFFNLVSTLTVADNVELPGLLAGRPPRQVREDRKELLAELGLEGKEDSTPGDLAGGEQQRVALARALINRPSLLLADEPTGSLDSKGTREVLRLLSRHHRHGQTIVLVTHDANVASGADRVISLHDGRVVDDISFEELPASGQAAADVVRLLG